MSKYHKILGLKEGASEKDIKKAYRQLAMQFHPDINNKEADKFHEIKDAYEFLLQNKGTIFTDNEQIKREDGKVFVRKYNKWVSQEEYDNLQKTAEDYRKQKQEFEEKRADFEYQELQKSYVFRAFKYVAIIGIIFTLLLLIDKYAQQVSSEVELTNFKSELHIENYQHIFETTLFYKTKNNTVSHLTFLGKNRTVFQKGIQMEVFKTPIFRLKTKIRIAPLEFYNIRKIKTFHIPLVFVFLIFISLTFILKGARAVYYLVLNSTVFGIPILIFLFLVFAYFN